MGTFRGLDFVLIASQNDATSALVTNIVEKERNRKSRNHSRLKVPLPTQPQGLPPVPGHLYIFICALQKQGTPIDKKPFQTI